MNNNPGIVKKTIIMVFVFDGYRLTFSDAGEPVDRHWSLNKFKYSLKKFLQVGSCIL
jgi:hypothetical protein